ncbi:unnamed protein product [Symbiodinium microadriaticum]|nr:unnamed protein product [Symbiodinium microadriaticum]
MEPWPSARCTGCTGCAGLSCSPCSRGPVHSKPAKGDLEPRYQEAFALCLAGRAASLCRRRHGLARRAGAPWDGLFGNTQKVVIPNSTREVLDQLKSSMGILVKSGLPRADVDLPAGLRLGLENVMDPLIQPAPEPSKAQVLQADRELARVFLAMFKVVKDSLSIVFRTNKQAAAAKKLWGDAVGRGSRGDKLSRGSRPRALVIYANWCRTEAERAKAEEVTTTKKKDRSQDPEATSIIPVPAISDLGGRSSAFVGSGRAEAVLQAHDPEQALRGDHRAGEQPIRGAKSENRARAFVNGWVRWARAPKHVLADLDSAFKDQFLETMDMFDTHVRCAAGQAHWQNGVAERHGAVWKAIWDKLVPERHIVASEVGEAAAAVSDAKNQLRNRSGYSPRQCVFGANQRLPGDVFEGSGERNCHEADTAESKFGRSQVIRMGARAAYYNGQASDAVKRAFHHKSNLLSCVLAAPEHVRAAKHEEVSEMLRMRLALNEVRDLMDRDEQPKLVDYSDDNVEPSENLELAAENDLEGGVPADASMEVEDERFAQALDEERRIEQATRNHQLTDVVPAVVKRQRAAILSRQASEAAASSGGERDSREVHMAAHRISERGKQKQLEKETSWGQIPPEERQLYRDAELTQWKEHVEFGAVGALSLEESRQKDMAVDAPTANRLSLLVCLQIALARGWQASIADVKAAFLNGVEAPRRLYFRQPRRGIPSLEAGQIIEILKGVFGLSTSPKLWWLKLSRELREMSFDVPGVGKVVVEPNAIDPCVFMLKGEGQHRGRPPPTGGRAPPDCGEERAVPEVCCGWLEGRQVRVHGLQLSEFHGDHVTVKQSEYARTRVEKVKVPTDFTVAVEAQRKQNKPTVGDLRETNRLVDAALRHQHCGLTLRRIEDQDLAILAYHDAAWGNVEPEGASPQDLEWQGNHTVASQLGSLTMLVEKKALQGEPAKFSIVDWKSKASARVCRSTFAGETMSACDALESALYQRGLMASLCTGQLLKEADARGLMQEGAPKAPSDKRLAIDIAVRTSAAPWFKKDARNGWSAMVLMPDAMPSPDKPCRLPLHWLPTSEQLADCLTKSAVTFARYANNLALASLMNSVMPTVGMGNSLSVSCEDNPQRAMGDEEGTTRSKAAAPRVSFAEAARKGAKARCKGAPKNGKPAGQAKGGGKHGKQGEKGGKGKDEAVHEGPFDIEGGGTLTFVERQMIFDQTAVSTSTAAADTSFESCSCSSKR